MKQHIDKEQFDELTLEQKRRLFEFYFPNIPAHPQSMRGGVKYGPIDINMEYLTIGRLIEFLLFVEFFPGEYNIGTGICNELWEQVKSKLENE